jgi:hypothetical protein
MNGMAGMNIEPLARFRLFRGWSHGSAAPVPSTPFRKRRIPIYGKDPDQAALDTHDRDLRNTLNRPLKEQQPKYQTLNRASTPFS